MAAPAVEAAASVAGFASVVREGAGWPPGNESLVICSNIY
jgi:hypothetical protein